MMVLALLSLLTAVILFRTYSFRQQTFDGDTGNKAGLSKGHQAVDKLSRAVQVPTVSHRDLSETDFGAFLEYHGLLEEMFPRLHKELKKEVINGYSLLYHWKGKSNKEGPALYMAHMDVVPIAEGTEEDWKYPPFSGEIADGYIWGRGSLDTKVTMISAMEAVEMLLAEGFQPENDIYLAFGHDEEIQSTEGAAKIAEHLKAKGITLRSVLDEGGIVNIGSIPGVEEPVAVVGICEKGSADLEVTVHSEGGHSSQPPKSTALSDISKVIVRLESKPMPVGMNDAVTRFMLTVGPYMGFTNRLILANLWLFKPLFMRVFQATPSGNAMLRSTIAPTMAKASNASNVLPQSASVTFNVRISPLDSVAKVEEHIRSLNSDMKLDIKRLQSKEPSNVSKVDSTAYKTIETTIPEVFGNVLVAPYVMLAATDSVKYQEICSDIYRFAPLVATQEDLALIHNTNERVSVENVDRCVSFFMAMMAQE